MRGETRRERREERGETGRGMIITCTTSYAVMILPAEISAGSSSRQSASAAPPPSSRAVRKTPSHSVRVVAPSGSHSAA